jgi:protoporphyrinogen oxidase
MMMSPTVSRIAVVGGGLMGITLAYRLSEAGHAVTVYERSSNLGGLATALDFEGCSVDRFYHTILSSDLSMQSLIEACELQDRLHFVATKQGFYDDGTLYPFTTPIDFLRFPALNLFQRFRFGLQIIAASFESDWRKMEEVPVERWLKRVSGEGVWRKVWLPLLRAKFDTLGTEIPATYIWARLRRMLGTRKGVTSTEMMCYLEGGYYALVKAMIAVCEERGVAFCTNTPIEEILIEDGQVSGIRTPEGVGSYDAVLSTLPSDLFARLIPDAPQAYREMLLKQQYLGVLCPILILKQPLTPYYVVNISDATIQFTAVVETTNLIDPQYVGGHHLVYLPRYLAPGSDLLNWSDERVEQEWMRQVRQMFPTFDDSQVTAFLVQRASHVEPLRPLGTTKEIPTMETPVRHLYLANTAMVYPDLNNGESVTMLAAKLADLVHEQMAS